MCTEEIKWSFPFNPLHLIYCIIILVLVIIAIFSYYYSGDSNLATLIAFAATIASIILSVLAIFMTILSNNSIGGMLHKVRDLHDTVTAIPENLNESVADLKGTTKELMLVNSDVNKSISALGDKLESLENHLVQNDNKLDYLLNRIPSNNTEKSDKSEPPSETLIEQYLNTLSLNGIFILYGFYLYQEKEKTGIFSISEFAKTQFGVDPAYLHGVIVASASANIISYFTIEGTNNMDITNLSLSPYITKDAIIKRIEIICADICRKFEELKKHYDPNIREKKIELYVDSIN